MSRKKAAAHMSRLSTKGQVISPKGLREKRGWKPGDAFIVEERPEGVMLMLKGEDAPSRMADVFGCLGPAPKVASLEDMRQAVRNEARRRWGNEYDDRD
jgi:AbrB family looped-hinge helix DNA binding protein